MRNIILTLSTLASVAACDTGDTGDTYDRVEAERARIFRVERACVDLGEPIAWAAVQYHDGALSWFVLWSNDYPYGLHPSVQFVGYREDME